MPLILDIETVPLADSMKAPYPEAERTPPGNYKSEDAIARWRLADKVAWEAGRAKDCSLNPRLGRVHTIGLSVTGFGGAVELLQAKAEADEREMLHKFWLNAAKQHGEVVTWNGVWDLRFLMLRTLAWPGLWKPSYIAFTKSWFRKYHTYPHFDCKAALLNWPSGHPSGEGLGVWCRFFGIEHTDSLTGADVYDLYLGGQHDAIGDHCRSDVAATAAIYERIEPMFGGM